MKLWFLCNLGGGGYDMTSALVIRAKDEDEARRIASHHSGDEGPDVWLHADTSSCEVLKHHGEIGVVCIDFNAA